jgi:CDP-paratose 2-epimerase
LWIKNFKKVLLLRGFMKILITGGAGFIGSNIAARLIAMGQEVIILDNLSRKGAGANLNWLNEQAEPGQLHFKRADIRQSEEVKSVFREYKSIDVVIHQAAQVAVTSSVVNPREDFEINALGTLNLLEIVRMQPIPPFFLFASTNKVYGAMKHVSIVENDVRYQYRDLTLGVSETESLDFHSPYGCSKGAADQYVRDYSRIYGLRTVVFRQSCIYGPRQFGIEDQGWVAWFIIGTVLGKPLTIYGDGKQVRDVLYVDDLVDLYLTAIGKINISTGKIYNIGGGANHQLSLLELLSLLRELIGKEIPVSYSDWRPGDQPVFVSDIRKVQTELNWKPKIGVCEGVALLLDWVSKHSHMIVKELKL